MITPQQSEAFEYSRKIVHLLSLLVPVAVHYSLLVTQLGLILLVLFYSLSEWFKVRGRSFVGQSLIAKIQREEELEGWAMAPIYLGLGVLVVITFFSFKASMVGIYQVGFCDTMAAFCGKKWGTTKLPPFNRKTYAGSIGFFLAALPVAFYFLPPSKAIIISLVGAFLESLPIKALDNFLIPVVVTFLTEQYLY